MSVRELVIKPDELAHFPDGAGYRWLELFDPVGSYGHAAICQRKAMLELHVSLTRWGPNIRRSMVSDVEWLKGEGRRLGVSRITGMRADASGVFAPELFRFARLFGFSEQSVVQFATMELD
ncbi:hypothetical protein [Pseudodesulfovibrio sp. zrk46]|uniref:hypothetical protein n=1 Tax=Pseudodesulfovibrio sp. zrk46 TaxID=2725288 RepID=UPI001448FD97|nr:hypothetical protein [Pseudodesulfovibrio sp. zrk46]QJB56187.1 hypothetical protein HFN16_07075 [Pseudodesulfovibrio sp. zrk46]